MDKKALNSCGVTLISTGTIDNHPRGLQIIRLLYFYEFLQHHHSEYRRCIFTDGFDVFFQGDPFTTDFSEQNIYFTLENETNNLLNESYFSKFPDFYPIICSQNIINCGVFAGGTSLLFTFFTYYLQMFPGLIGIWSQTKNYHEPYSDQDALNYFVYVWLPNNNNLYNQIIFLPSASRFSSMIGEIRYSNPNTVWTFPNFSIFSYVEQKMIKPLLVHQYTYKSEIVHSLIDSCGLLSHQKSVNKYYRLR